MAKQPWDPSVQALAALPEVVKRLGDDIQWTADLGNAFLAQQSDVMDAVQRMRKKAQDKGSLKTTEQQKVETKVIEQKTVIVIEQANPQVVYVPSYNPVVVYGPAYYPYPPIYYPPWGYYAAGAAISFGVGVMMGAFWSGVGWGCGWGGNNVYINHNSNFNVNGGNRDNIGRAGIGVSNQPGLIAVRRSLAVAEPEPTGRTTRSIAAALLIGIGLLRTDSAAARAVIRFRSARPAPATNWPTGRESGQQHRGRRSGGGGVGNRPRVLAGSATAQQPAGTGGADRIGSRDLSRSGGGNRDAFGGGSRGYNGSSARSSSSRGSSSMSSRGGGRVQSRRRRRSAQIGCRETIRGALI